MSNAAADLYSEELLDYAGRKTPRADLGAPSLKVEGGNPFCGDRAKLSLWIDDGRVVGTAWDVTGCVVSKAGCSLCAELLEGKTPSEIAGLGLCDIQAVFGERIHRRYRCALLALWLAQEAFKRHAANPAEREWSGISVGLT